MLDYNTRCIHNGRKSNTRTGFSASVSYNAGLDVLIHELLSREDTGDGCMTWAQPCSTFVEHVIEDN